MMPKAKATNVYDSTAAGLNGVLDELCTNEPKSDGLAAAAALGPGPIDATVTSASTLPATAGGDAPGPIVLGAELPVAVPAVDPQAAAGNAVELVLSAIGPVCDGEWQPDDDAERQELVDALAKVLERRPMLLNIAGRIPPELILAAVVHRFARKRMTRPSTAARLKAWAAGTRPGSLIRRMFGHDDQVQASTPAAGVVGPVDPYDGYQ